MRIGNSQEIMFLEAQSRAGLGVGDELACAELQCSAKQRPAFRSQCGPWCQRPACKNSGNQLSGQTSSLQGLDYRAREDWPVSRSFHECPGSYPRLPCSEQVCPRNSMSPAGWRAERPEWSPVHSLQRVSKVSGLDAEMPLLSRLQETP